MKILAFLLIILSHSVFAKNIVLLTSLPTQDEKLESVLEESFIKKSSDFSPEYQIIVRHKADQEILYNYLNDPQTHALFWLSHGGYLKTPSNSGVRPTPMLLDYQQDNVAQVFQSVHPNVKYLAVIGCYSSQILEEILPSRKDLDSYIPPKKVVAQLALRRSIKHFRYTHHRKENITYDLPQKQGHLVKVIRKSGSTAAKSLKAFVGGELVSVLPKMAPNEVATFGILIPVKPSYKKQDLKIIFESGQSPLDTKNYIGDLSLLYKSQELWKLFSKPTGEPFGTNERIFIFTGKSFGETL